MTPWLIVASDFVRTGGMDVANLGLAEYLGAAGREVHLVTHRVEESLRSASSVVIHEVPRPGRSNVAGEMLLERAARKVHRLLLKRASPVVVVNGGNARLPSTINWVHYVHAAYKPQLNVARSLLRRRNMRRERDAFGLARFLIADSQRTALSLRALPGLQGKEIVTIYYGNDLSRFHPIAESQRAQLTRGLGLAEGQLRAIFVGALGDARKGFDTVFAAWELLSHDPTWDVELLVVGTGRMREHWMRTANRRGLRTIQFLGFRRDVDSIMQVGDVVLAPSRYEPYGLAVQEALCCGKPVIVSRLSGIAERLTSSRGVLLLDNPESPIELAAKVAAWRSDVAGYAHRVEAISRELRNRSWADMASEIVTLAAKLPLNDH